MWDRCHWRLLYYARENVPSFIAYLDEKHSERKDEIIAFFEAMNEDDHIYDFASKCGSWDWTGIAIMLVSCKLLVFNVYMQHSSVHIFFCGLLEVL